MPERLTYSVLAREQAYVFVLEPRGHEIADGAFQVLGFEKNADCFSEGRGILGGLHESAPFGRTGSFLPASSRSGIRRNA
jgi:hypothetical protein